MRQLRDGYPGRPKNFPVSVGLIGLRDVRDYKVASGGSDRLNTSSPFNIKVRSLTLRNFHAIEVEQLYQQHTHDTGQVFTPEAIHYQQVNKLPGRIEKRSVSICPHLNGIPFWAGLKTLIRVESSRQIIRHNHIEVQKETRYYISSLKATAREFGDRIRGYWGVENKVHYVRSGNSRGG